MRKQRKTLRDRARRIPTVGVVLLVVERVASLAAFSAELGVGVDNCGVSADGRRRVEQFSKRLDATLSPVVDAGSGEYLGTSLERDEHARTLESAAPLTDWQATLSCPIRCHIHRAEDVGVDQDKIPARHLEAQSVKEGVGLVVRQAMDAAEFRPRCACEDVFERDGFGNTNLDTRW